MLTEISVYNDIGHGDYAAYVLAFLKQAEGEWSAKNLAQFIGEKNYFTYGTIDGGVSFLKMLGILKEDTKNHLNVKDYPEDAISSGVLSDYIINLFFEKLVASGEFNSLFPEHLINYESRDNTVYIASAAFGFRYSCIKKYLRNDKVIRLVDHNLYSVMPQWTETFKNLLKQTEQSRKIFNLDQLKQKLIAQEERGLLAELYVENYENLRLNNKKAVLRISDTDVSAGYDIASFESEESPVRDRFIEVKSYISSRATFYWSRNEMDAAARYGDSYWLYLIDFKRMNNVDYTPLIIQNPHVMILESDDWLQEPQVIKFTKPT